MKRGGAARVEMRLTHTHTHRPACVALPLMYRMDGQRMIYTEIVILKP